MAKLKGNSSKSKNIKSKDIRNRMNNPALAPKRSILQLDLTDDDSDEVVILEVVSKKKRRRNEDTILLDSLTLDSDNSSISIDLSSSSSYSSSNLSIESRNSPVDISIVKVEETEPDPEESSVQSTSKEPGTVRVTHPLMIPEILERVFDYLDVEEESLLLPCEYVCLLWKNLLNRRSESLEFYQVNSPPQGALTTFEDIVNAIPPHRTRLRTQTLPPQSMEYFCKTMSSGLKSLHLDLLNIQPQDSSNEFLPKSIQLLAKYCTKLEELTLDLSRSSNISSSSSVIPHIYLPIKKLNLRTDRSSNIQGLPMCPCPELKQLSYTGSWSTFVQILSKNSLTLDSVTELNLYFLSSSEIPDDFVQFFLNQKLLRIQKLKLRFLHNVSIQKLRRVFHHLRESLVDLKIEFDYPSVKLVLPLEQNFLVPLSLTKLRRLDINEQSTVALINSLHLPNLRSCTCFYTVLARGDMFREVLEKDARPEVHCLESLRLYDNSIELPIFQENPTPFRGLKYLELEHGTDVMFEVILKSQRGLERLKISNLYSLKSPRRIFGGKGKKVRTDWDEVMTGRRKPRRFRKEEIPPEEYRSVLGREKLRKVGPSIKNLKKLKHLSLGIDCSSQRGYKLSDFSIYLGLMELKELQHLELNQHVFSDLALTELRKELVPFCRMTWTG